MTKTVKLTIAALVATLATTVGMAAPAEAKAPVVVQKGTLCC